MIDIEELKKLALAATPGPWEAVSNSVRDQIGPNGVGGFLVADCPANIGKRLEDAAFIAAANPRTVLALIARIEALENGRISDQH